MWNCELHLKWVNNTLARLVAMPELSYDHAITLFNAWVKLVQAKIVKQEEFTASEFLLACLGYFTFYDLKDEKYHLSSDLYERSRSTVCHRSLNSLDVVEAKERFNNLSTDLIKKLSLHCELDEKKSAFSLFELVHGLQREGRFECSMQRYRRVYIASKGKPRVIAGKTQDMGSMNLIPTEFIESIFYDYYGLDPKIVKNGLPMVNRYTAEEAAQKLGVTKNNLIKKCFDYGIGVYVNASKYKIHHTSGSIHKEIIDTNKDDAFLYPHRGLVRLSRSGIEMLYKAPITTNNQQCRNIDLQPSLTELIQGYAWCIELRGAQQITIDDLWFIEDEILAYLRESQSAVTETSVDNRTKKAGKQPRVHRLKLLIQKIYATLPDKSAKAIWSFIENNQKHFNIWLELIHPWIDGRGEARIRWGTRDRSEKPFSQGAFANYVSRLNTGKEKFSEKTYEQYYDDWTIEK